MREECAKSERDAICRGQHETFGHLGPIKGKHLVEILFSYTSYGEIIIIDDKCPTLQNSPWHFESLNNLLFKVCNPNALKGEEPLAEGKVYLFNGYIIWDEVESYASAWGEAIGATEWQGRTTKIAELN
jgi:hypothetical protein